MPVRMATISSITAPRVSARKADQKLMPNPSVAPSRNWESAESWPKRWTATVTQEYRSDSGTLDNE
jgi:hypothetical protein